MARRRWGWRLLGVVLAVAGAVAAVVGVGRRRTDRAVDRLVSDLFSAVETAGEASGSAETDRSGTVTPEEWADLPDPVGRYFDAVLGEEARRVETARVEQRGEIDLGVGDWRDFAAVQRFGANPPGFVWDARVRVAPGVSVRVVDAYVDGEGSLWGRLFSVVPVVEVPPGPETNEAELLRYLGETVWMPTALLSEHVEWEPIDDRSARATVDDGSASASLVFHFREDDLIERVHTEKRYRQEDGTHAPWTGHFGAYREFEGVLVPTEAEVEWDPPEGDGPYWGATVESVAYDVDPSR